MIEKISKIIEAKERIARIQMDKVEVARQKIEDVAADFKAEDLGASAKKVLTGLAKLDKHIEDKNFGLAESTIEASIKELRSTKKRIFNDAIQNLEEAVISDEEEKTDIEDEELVPEEEVSLEEPEEKKNSKKSSVVVSKLGKRVKGSVTSINTSEVMSFFSSLKKDSKDNPKLKESLKILEEIFKLAGKINTIKAELDSSIFNSGTDRMEEYRKKLDKLIF